MTRIVNVRNESCDVKICRGTIFGNPYVIGRDGTREQVIARYKEWFNFCLKDKDFETLVRGLKGKRLGCFCKQPHIEIPCHGDVILEWINKND